MSLLSCFSSNAVFYVSMNDSTFLANCFFIYLLLYWDFSDISRLASYVPQDDIIFTQTVVCTKRKCSLLTRIKFHRQLSVRHFHWGMLVSAKDCTYSAWWLSAFDGAWNSSEIVFIQAWNLSLKLEKFFVKLSYKRNIGIFLHYLILSLTLIQLTCISNMRKHFYEIVRFQTVHNIRDKTVWKLRQKIFPRCWLIKELFSKVGLYIQLRSLET